MERTLNGLFLSSQQSVTGYSYLNTSLNARTIHVQWYFSIFLPFLTSTSETALIGSVNPACGTDATFSI